MKDKKKNTNAFSIFGSATATSANGDNSEANTRATSTVNITVDVAGLISKGRDLLQDESLDTSSGKLQSFLALGKELLKAHPNLVSGFEKATNLSRVGYLFDPVKDKESSQRCAVAAVKKGLDFLEMLS